MESAPSLSKEQHVKTPVPALVPVTAQAQAVSHALAQVEGCKEFGLQRACQLVVVLLKQGSHARRRFHLLLTPIGALKRGQLLDAIHEDAGKRIVAARLDVVAIQHADESFDRVTVEELTSGDSWICASRP